MKTRFRVGQWIRFNERWFSGGIVDTERGIVTSVTVDERVEKVTVFWENRGVDDGVWWNANWFLLV